MLADLGQERRSLLPRLHALAEVGLDDALGLALILLVLRVARDLHVFVDRFGEVALLVHVRLDHLLRVLDRAERPQLDPVRRLQRLLHFQIDFIVVRK